ncbi:MAG: hypothetical protein M0T82_16715 [Desulfobacteraceae bacterium]|nr:hypothetical protein [Desulfobacteraceae bacterium]
MEMGGTNSGASTYAMKKAMEMPKLMLSLIEQTAGLQKQPPVIQSAAQPVDLEAMAGKGGIINLTI